MNHKHGLINQIISSVLLFAMIVTLIPLSDRHEHVAEAATLPTITSRTCPKGGGNPPDIGYAGCRACGGTGKRYLSTTECSKAGDNEGFGAGSGYNTKEVINGNSKTITYYRCYNCGDTGYDCKQYDERIYTDNFSWDDQSKEWKFSYRTPGSAKAAEGYVPIRWCPTCGPLLDANHQAYETIATWAQIHIEEAVVKTYTVKVVANPSSAGTAGDSGTYEEGKTINLWYAPKAGYMFTGWSGATVTNDTHTVSKNVTITANFAPEPTRIPEATPTPVPTKKPLPTATPRPTATPIPLPPIQYPTPVPQRENATPPTPGAFSDEHSSICYDGTQHVCTTSSCYSPIYHSHYSSCLGPSYVSGYRTCTASGCSSGYVQVTCTGCSGKGTVKDNCSNCNGTATQACTSCNGTGSSSSSCTTCGGDGLVSGTCGGSIKDSNTHQSKGSYSKQCSSCSGGGKCTTCGGDGLEYVDQMGGGYNKHCSSCGGGKNCTSCGGSGTKSYDKCSCGGNNESGSMKHNYSYKCSSCGASASSSGTCSKSVANAKTCSKCTGGTVSVTCSTCKGDKTITCQASGCLGGKVTVTCSTCSGNKTVSSPCSTCGGNGQVPVYSQDYVCGYSSSSIVGYNGPNCGKTNGAYYKNGTRVYPVCDKIVTNLEPFHLKQTLEMGDSPDYGAYATFISNPCSCGNHSYPCVHGEQPVKEVVCSASGLNTSLYNTWQTVTLSYGSYSDTAKNAKPKTATIKVNIAGNLTVTFDADGGTVSPSTKTVVYGETYGSLPVPVRTNYTFNGWMYNEDGVNKWIKEDSIVRVSTNHTLTAWWDSNDRTVTFDPNGGTVSPTTKTVTYGKAYGELPTPIRTGYVFDGWYYGPDKITASSVVSCYGNPTLVAEWKAGEYSITLNPNGGSSSLKTVDVRYNDTANNTIVTDAKYPGYTLAGWYTSINGGSAVYDANGKWVNGTYWSSGRWNYPGNVTLYAHWNTNTYIVDLNGMGATSLPQASTTIVYLQAGNAVQIPSKTGYRFDGFYTEPNGSGTKMFDNAGKGVAPWTTPSDGMVYANWIPISYTIQEAEDEIRIEPVEITKSTTLDYDDTYTIPAAKADKSFTVSYDLQEAATGTSKPMITLIAANTNAYHTFVGWQLFRNSGGKYNYIRLYSSGTTVQFLASVQDDVVTLFPYWSGSGATVELPEPTCIGYNFRGWGFVPYEPNPDNLLYPEEGGDNAYKPVGDETLYAQWEAKNYVVELVAKDATTQSQTAVTATFDQVIPNVVIPERDMHRFMGYYDKLNADGTPASDAKQYYDKDGTGLEIWTEEDEKVTKLYAYWKEKPDGSIYNFEVYDVFGTPAWEEIRGTEYGYTIGVRDETSVIWDTLPLRTGVHPLYCNLGGLPTGGAFSFRVVSTGVFAEENVTLTIIPHLCPVGEEGYYDGDLYFEQETAVGNFLKKWLDEEQTMVLYASADSVQGEDETSREWSGTFQLPENLWVAKIGTAVEKYQQQFGLNFEEPFWIKDARLMLRFTLCLENGDGECLYYGMLPEESKENAWVEEAGDSYREDYDKNRYEILGGEVAVIYPGDSVERWNQIYGIY